ncbi:MAG: cytochrome C oxidase subunit IV family protein [Acidimicrobiales bacterium]
MTSTETVEPAAVASGGHDEDRVGGHVHPSDLQYVYIALFLAAITAVEVVLYYVKLDFLIGALLLGVLGVVKFATVAMFFMHLRFDSRIFRWFFCGGLALALIVYPILLTTFHFWWGHGARTN